MDQDTLISASLNGLRSLWQELQGSVVVVVVDGETKKTFTSPPTDGATVVSAAHLDSLLVPVLQRHDACGLKQADTEDEAATDQDDSNDDDDACMALECLISFVSSPLTSSKDDKALVVSSGALDATLRALRRACCAHVDHLDEGVSEQESEEDAQAITAARFRQQKVASLAMQVLSGLAVDASDALKNDHLLPAVPTVHKTMYRYLSQDETAEDGDPKFDKLHTTAIQRSGCCFLRHLSNPLLQELVAAGSTDAIVSAMKQHPEDGLVQEYGSAALYNLLPLILSSPSSPLGLASSASCTDATSSSSLSSVSSTSSLLLSNLPEIVVRGMECHGDLMSVQQYGILVLKRLCQNDVGNYEKIVSQGGLSAVLRNLDVPSAEQQACQSPDERNDLECLAQLAIQFLQDLSRTTNYSDLDMLRAIAAKGGMNAILQLMSQSESNPYRHAVNIQDPAMACLRNLCLHPDNRWEAMMTLSYGDVVPLVLSNMDRFHQDAAIQAYGCDVLGRLALVKLQDTGDNQNADEKKTDESNSKADEQYDDIMSVIAATFKAMKEHRRHAGVQDRSVFLLVALCSSQGKGDYAMECLLSQRDAEQSAKDLIGFLKDTEIPPKGKERLNVLVEMLEQKSCSTSGQSRQGKENNSVFKGWNWTSGKSSPKGSASNATTRGLSWRSSTSTTS